MRITVMYCHVSSMVGLCLPTEQLFIDWFLLDLEREIDENQQCVSCTLFPAIKCQRKTLECGHCYILYKKVVIWLYNYCA